MLDSAIAVQERNMSAAPVTSAAAVAPLLLILALCLLMIGLHGAQEQASVLRAQLESARSAGESETARRLARRLSHKVFRDVLAYVAVSLGLVILAIGTLVAPALTDITLVAILFALFGLFMLLAIYIALVDYIVIPLRDLTRDLRFGRRIQRELKPR
jgi:hypothetical protein